eukprot:UN24044
MMVNKYIANNENKSYINYILEHGKSCTIQFVTDEKINVDKLNDIWDSPEEILQTSRHSIIPYFDYTVALTIWSFCHLDLDNMDVRDEEHEMRIMFEDNSVFPWLVSVDWNGASLIVTEVANGQFKSLGG